MVCKACKAPKVNKAFKAYKVSVVYKAYKVNAENEDQPVQRDQPALKDWKDLQDQLVHEAVSVPKVRLVFEAQKDPKDLKEYPDRKVTTV